MYDLYLLPTKAVDYKLLTNIKKEDLLGWFLTYQNFRLCLFLTDFSCSIGMWNYCLAPSKLKFRIFLCLHASPLWFVTHSCTHIFENKTNLMSSEPKKSIVLTRRCRLHPEVFHDDITILPSKYEENGAKLSNFLITFSCFFHVKTWGNWPTFR